MAPDAFYVADGDGWFASTELTKGPWDENSQHAGPPAALVGRAIERAAKAPGMQVARLTFEILRPVPVAPLRVEAQVVRPGRSVEMLEASLSDEQGPVMLARGWRVRLSEVDIAASDVDDPPRLPEEAEPGKVFPVPGQNYLAAIEWRFSRGSFVEPGPAVGWARMRYPLLAGEEISPLTRVLIVADSGNGISSVLDWREWYFINVDLSVHLHRMPVGEWVCLDASTSIDRQGIGLASSVLHDEDGRIGRGLQSLFVAPRS